jgi:hypothetical protein
MCQSMLCTWFALRATVNNVYSFVIYIGSSLVLCESIQFAKKQLLGDKGKRKAETKN